MSTLPLFQEPISSPEPKADIIQVDTALESMRNSGFDLTAAVGEPVDNSVEAGASLIRVLPRFGARKKSIDRIAFADNGRGIQRDILAHALSMGFSTRYGQRVGLGRFGVGLKLAGLSLGERIDIYTKQEGDPTIRHAYIDLDEIRAKDQTHIEAREVADWPKDFKDAMTDSEGALFSSGTLVIYGKIDALTSGGTYGTSLDEKLADLRTFIARAYRYFLDKGLKIELDGRGVTLLDPLFLMDNPRIVKQYPKHGLQGQLIDSTTITIDGHPVEVTVTIVPREFRWKRGEGGDKDHTGRDIREFHIADGTGKISMVRNRREINYDIVPRMLPTGIEELDRYIGVEIKFPAELDDFFQVRNVKRGAVPVDKLRKEVREWLRRPVKSARERIRADWDDVDEQQRNNSGEHAVATEVASRADKTSPKGQAGQELTEEDNERIIEDLLEDLDLAGQQKEAEQIREQVKVNPFTLVDGGWPGKELFEIDHLNGKAIVRLNHRHIFIRDVYDKLKATVKAGSDSMDTQEVISLLRKTETALDLLILAYAKAENMHPDPAQYEGLRSFWGQFTHAFMREMPSDC
ncbi:ATP-binding protein [Nocardia brasiliensis]|uniref:ATP-binding protein n=1 Tax=Nocardia brasiliensis TaxID=37326 RepID=UPI00189380F2|nr:ATP-binding protein [Nocardia brasiliensis]MBF6547614.1 ATP-binding protein [Nocardia brasiliensis]